MALRKYFHKSFMSCDPNSSVRTTSEHFTAASACISTHYLRKWFEGIQKYLKEEGLYDILCDPTRFFNGEENGFFLYPKSKAVLALKGCKDVDKVLADNAKENCTVMFVFSAARVMCYPMVVYNYKRIPQNILCSVPTNWRIDLSDSGWWYQKYFISLLQIFFILFGRTLHKTIFTFICWLPCKSSHISIQYTLCWLTNFFNCPIPKLN